MAPIDPTCALPCETMEDELFLRVSNLTATVLNTPQGEKSSILIIINVNETK